MARSIKGPGGDMAQAAVGGEAGQSGLAATSADPVAAALADFPVPGIQSETQADLIEQSLLSIGGVWRARVSYATGRARVRYDPGQTTIEALRKTVAGGLSGGPPPPP